MKNEDFQFLQKYEVQLQTASNSDYARYIPRLDLQRMADILTESGWPTRVNTSCPRCVLRLLKDVAILYFEEIGKRNEATTTQRKRNGQRRSKAKKNG